MRQEQTRMGKNYAAGAGGITTKLAVNHALIGLI